MASQIRDQVIAITGASSGIGRAAALKFAERGARLVLIARRERALDELAEQCRRLGGQARVAALDVTDGDALQRAVDDALASHGRIDAWINNASMLMVGKFLDCSPEVYRRLIDTNFFGYVNGARAVLPQFKRQGHGTLVNVASMAGKIGTPYQSAYSASKFAVVGWSESLRMELFLEGEKAIHVCTVLPAFIDTPLFQHAANYTGRALKPGRPVYSPDKVASALLRAVRSPRREIVVGLPARVAMASHAIAPDLTGKLLAKGVEYDHFADHPAPRTDGNAFQALDGYASASGGWRGHAGKGDRPAPGDLSAAAG